MVEFEQRSDTISFIYERITLAAFGRIGGGVQGRRQEDSSSGSCNNSGSKGRDFDYALHVVSVGRHKFKMTQ